MNTKKLEDYVRTIPGFPKEGILFRDVTGILDSGEGFRMAMDELENAVRGLEVDKIAAPESRGFIFGAALADRLHCAFIPVRKPGKLPRETIHEEYSLEYGTATVHMHCDAVSKGDKVLIIDDLLATGGTVAATARLVERCGGVVVKMLFPIELMGFRARQTVLAAYDVASLIQYTGT